MESWSSDEVFLAVLGILTGCVPLSSLLSASVAALPPASLLGKLHVEVACDSEQVETSAVEAGSESDIQTVKSCSADQNCERRKRPHSNGAPHIGGGCHQCAVLKSLDVLDSDVEVPL